MRRAIPAVSGALALALPAASTAGAIASRSPAAKPKPKKKVFVHKAKLLGPSVDMRWGPIQVTAIVKTTTIRVGKKKTVKHRLVGVAATYPTERRRSAFINEQAIPLLRQEVLRAQSANVDVLSGATLTCEAYAQSLQSILHRVHMA